MAKRPRNKFLQTYLRYPLEAAGVWLVLGFVSLLPIDTASNFGGWLGRSIGPRLGISKRARRNLRLAFPDKSGREVEEIVVAMWDNLGRTAGEYPNLGAIADPASGRVEAAGEEYVAPYLNDGGAAIVTSGHFANWEVMGLTAEHHQVRLTTVVRRPNNPLVEGVLERLRGAAGGQRIYKGAAGAKQAFATLKNGKVLALLVDQKMNDGIPVEFFGHKAMTAPAVAQLALKFKCPIIPIRTERLGPGRFRVSAQAPMEFDLSGDRHADIAMIMRSINALFEDWIRERPAEWLWLHRRWPKELYRDMREN